MAEEAILNVQINGLKELEEFKKTWGDLQKNKKLEPMFKMNIDKALRFDKLGNVFKPLKDTFSQFKKDNATTAKLFTGAARGIVSGVGMFASAVKKFTIGLIGFLSGMLFWGFRMAKELRGQQFAAKATGVKTGQVRALNFALSQSGIASGENAGEDVLRKVKEAQITPSIGGPLFGWAGIADWQKKNPMDLLTTMMSKIAGMSEKDFQKGTIGREIAQGLGLDVTNIRPDSMKAFQRYYAQSMSEQPSEGEVSKMAKLSETWEKMKQSMENNGIRIFAKFAPVIQKVMDYMDAGSKKLTAYLLSPAFTDDVKRIGDIFKYFAVKLSGLLEKLGVKNFISQKWKSDVAAMEDVEPMIQARGQRLASAGGYTEEGAGAVARWLTQAQKRGESAEVMARYLNVQERETATAAGRTEYVTFVLKNEEGFVMQKQTIPINQGKSSTFKGAN